MTQHYDAFRTAGLAAWENWRAAAACRSADPDLFFRFQTVVRAWSR